MITIIRKVIQETSKALRKAHEVRVPMIRFSDPDETILFKETFGRSKGDVLAPEFFNLWNNTFQLGSEDWSAEAKLCITNKRCLFYRIEHITDVVPERTWGLGGNVSYNFGPPFVEWIQIPLENVCKLARKNTVFSKEMDIHFAAVPSITGNIPTSGSLKIPHIDKVPKNTYVVLSDKSLQNEFFKALKSYNDIKLSFKLSDEAAQLVKECMSEVFPGEIHSEFNA